MRRKRGFVVEFEKGLVMGVDYASGCDHAVYTEVQINKDGTKTVVATGRMIEGSCTQERSHGSKKNKAK